jgi:hypothetical protein
MTTREYFLTLPAPIGLLAIANCTRQHGEAVIDTAADDLPDALHSGIHWKETPEGIKFWQDVYDAACDGTAFPAAPGSETGTPDAGDGPFGCDVRNIDFNSTARRAFERAGMKREDFEGQFVKLLTLVFAAGYTKGAASK